MIGELRLTRSQPAVRVLVSPRQLVLDGASDLPASVSGVPDVRRLLRPEDSQLVGKRPAAREIAPGQCTYGEPPLTLRRWRLRRRRQARDRELVPDRPGEGALVADRNR